MDPKNDAVALGATGSVVLVGVLAFAVTFGWLSRVPLPEEAPSTAPGLALIAYNADGDEPLVLYRGTGRIELDGLRLNWRPLLELNLPIWRPNETPTAFPGTRDPASFFATGCHGVDEMCRGDVVLVGQVNVADIAFIEAAIDGSWRRFFVTVPGFIKRLPRETRIGDVRWLDRDGRAVWSLDRNEDGRIEPLSSRDPRPHPHVRFSGQE